MSSSFLTVLVFQPCCFPGSINCTLNGNKKMTASTMDFFDFSCDALYPSINELVFGSQIEPTTQRVNSEDIMTTGMLATLNSNVRTKLAYQIF